MRDVRGDQRHLGPPGDGRLRESVTLAPGRPVPQEPHGIQLFAGSPGGYDDLAAGQVLAEPARAPGEDPDRGRENLGWLRQPADPRVRTGQPAAGGLEHDRAAVPQRGHVGPGGGVLPHLGVHRGRVQHRAPGGQQGGGEQVTRHTRGGPGHEVCGRRGDDDKIGGLPEPDVRDFLGTRPGVRADGLTR
jgi:hypothetical protein